MEDLVTMQVVDWEGPIVEIQFRRPIATSQDVADLARQARAFVEDNVVRAGRSKAYFLTCYEGFAVARECAAELQQAFLAFNGQYSKRDVRYGGTIVAKSIVISTAIRSESSSEHSARGRKRSSTSRR